MRYTPLAPEDPTSVGRYVLIGRLGAGGMGTVYLGRDPAGGTAGGTVAVKLLHERLAGDPAFLARFAAEAAAAGRVAGFCTARVIEANVRDRRPYLVTEYVDGPSLQEVLSATGPEGPLPASHVEALAVGVAAALTAIHAAGLVHRDLKPSNVMLSNFGPKVIDFGVARAFDAKGSATEPGVLVGTPGWMAPEQLQGAATAASDVFVWGLLVARAGTRWRPVPELRVVPPTAGDLAELQAGLAQAVTAALHRDPHRRPTARDLLLRLCGSADAGPVRTATAVLSRPWDAPYPTVAPPRPAAGRSQAPRGQQTPHCPQVPQAAWGQQAARGQQAPHGPQAPHGSPAPSGSPMPSGSPARRAPRMQPVPWSPVPRQRRWYRRKRLLLPLATIAAAALINNASQPEGQNLPPLTARDGILEFAITDMKCGIPELGEPPVQRRAQGQFCTVQLRVRNFGNDARRVHVGRQKLHDQDGRVFSADDGAWVYLPESVPFFQQEINPGNEVSATLVYDIAGDAVPKQLEVHDSPLSGGAPIKL